MANKKQKKTNDTPPDEEATPEKQVGALNWRGWVIRGVVLSVLIFGFVAWRLYPIVGNMAFLWATLLAGAILGWLGFSYYLLNR
ncbi:MAG: hypothetical protein R3C44_15325 [Chloroflexota bacterium]